jgi:Repeat of unknown function (DUF5648)
MRGTDSTMRNLRRTVGALLLTAGITVTGVGTTVQASASGTATAGEASTTATTWRVRMHELATPGKRGWFYTVNPAEYWRARRAGFTPANQYLGHIANRRVAGTLPLYRLRVKTRSSYLLTLSAAERNRLVASGRYVYEGVLGYTSTTGGTGKFRIYRVSKAGLGWRVVQTRMAVALIRQGWHRDGTLGYVWTYK